jgi:iron(III) transport system ATP-binding protein
VPDLRSNSLRILGAVLALMFAIGCDRGEVVPVLEVKSWHAWMLPPVGAVQPTPRSLTTGPAGEVAVLDTAGRVVIYDRAGALLRQWKMLDVQFGKPEGIVWLKDDRIVVCDTHYHRLVWFNQKGEVLRTVGQRGFGKAEFVFPVGIAVDRDENLYVCEYGGHDRIQVFTREGQWLREFGSAGTGNGQFQRPSGLTWQNGKVYVADAVNHRVLIFKDSGEYLGVLGGDAPPVFDLPYDIASAADGRLYVIEYGAGRLTQLSMEGKVLARFAKNGTGNAEFATPWGLTVDSQMRVLVADTKNRRIVALQL